MSVNEIVTSPTTPQPPASTTNAAQTTPQETLASAAATISKDPTTGLWRVDQNPLEIPVGFDGTIEWTIVSPGGLFPHHAPILFDFDLHLPDVPPSVPSADRVTCSMRWSNAEAFQRQSFTYYAFVQEGGSEGPVFRVDPTVQNQPPG